MAGRIQLLSDVLPSDAVATSYRAREGISFPYEVHVEFVTTDASFQIDDCLRHRMLLEVDDGQGALRFYDGLPDEVRFVGSHGERLTFEVRLRPAIAALEHREGSQIFQGKSPVDVIKKLLADAGVDKDVSWQLRKTYAPREFLCQYREHDMSFLHRLLEDEGIFYFFRHSANDHHLVFADDPGAFTAPEGQQPVILSMVSGANGAQPLLGIHRARKLRPTYVALRDYDFEKPDVYADAALPAQGPVRAGPIAHFEYPGGFTQGAEGARRAEGRIRSLRGDVDRCRGKSRAAGLAAGAPFTIEGANEPFLNGSFVVAELASKGTSHGDDACENEFVAVPKDAPFAAPRRTKKPKIRGIQTVVVTGPTSGPEDINVDKYGRVKVRFLWDRSAKQDDTSSCWLRVAQLGMGGSMFLPRVGWEMSVAFLDGDPDRPFVLGRTYNAENTPPYPQPASAADGSLKSMSTPGGAGHNEVKMSDTAGSQGMSMSSQKDMNASTGNDKNETVAVNDDTSVGSNYNLTVGSNETATIGGNQSIDVGNAYQVKVSGAQSVSVGGNDQTHAKCDMVEKVGGARAYTVSGNQITISNGIRQDITGAFSRDVGAVQVNMSLASIDDTMLTTYDEKAGAVILRLVHGADVETVSGSKDQTSLAGEFHMASALSTQATGVKQLIGGVHLRKIAGDLVVQAPKIVIGGGVGKFTGGGSSVKLNGGPVTITGSKIAIEAASIVKMASNLKIG